MPAAAFTVNTVTTASIMISIITAIILFYIALIGLPI